LDLGSLGCASLLDRRVGWGFTVRCPMSDVRYPMSAVGCRLSAVGCRLSAVGSRLSPRHNCGQRIVALHAVPVGAETNERSFVVSETPDLGLVQPSAILTEAFGNPGRHVL
jgi:hypothetical protein